MLSEVDPEYASEIHFNNVKRVARALEYYRLTGEKRSDHNRESKHKESPYNLAFLVLNMDRQKLYDRIDLRVDIMMKNGLEAEVRNLINMGYSPDLVSMQGLGYKMCIRDRYKGSGSHYYIAVIAGHSPGLRCYIAVNWSSFLDSFTESDNLFG